ncbi:MAG: DegT/DnrJ/EryC1/StrS family aminotransferase [Halobacteriota archaeon]|nr:DegT/DnrJ/EryC1/StrS family aminotransferase [Halobacteriota archaeon]
METIDKELDIPLTRPYFNSDELKEIETVLNSGWVSQGPKVIEFENKFAEYIGSKYAVAVTNCTCALHLSLLALGVGVGDEVLVADFTHPATGHSVLYCGSKPIFIDVDKRTYNINPDLLEDKITENTKAIIPVHIFGQPANMDPILEIASDHNLYVIEDAACAHGAKYKGKNSGTMGIVGCFSFHARKGVTTGEGGVVVTNDKELADEIRNLSTYGTTTCNNNGADEFTITKFIKLGFNYKMSDISAAVGVAQLRKLDSLIEKRILLAKYWDEKIGELDFIEPPFCIEDVKHVYQSYVCLVDQKIMRNTLIERTRRMGVQTQIGTYACHIQPIYNSEQKCLNSFDLYKRSISLPMYFKESEEVIDDAIRVLKKAIGELK